MVFFSFSICSLSRTANKMIWFYTQADKLNYNAAPWWHLTLDTAKRQIHKTQSVLVKMSRDDEGESARKNREREREFRAREEKNTNAISFKVHILWSFPLAVSVRLISASGRAGRAINIFYLWTWFTSASITAAFLNFAFASSFVILALSRCICLYNEPDMNSIYSIGARGWRATAAPNMWWCRFCPTYCALFKFGIWWRFLPCLFLSRPAEISFHKTSMNTKFRTHCCCIQVKNGKQVNLKLYHTQHHPTMFTTTECKQTGSEDEARLRCAVTCSACQHFNHCFSCLSVAVCVTAFFLSSFH